MPKAEFPSVAWQVEHSIAAGKVVVKCLWAWLAKGLVKAKCFVGDENGRRGVVPQSGVQVTRGFVGSAACKPFEAGQMAMGFVGKRACRQKWPLWVVVR